jgi:soluble lytic murein transglycosylase-like protein
MLRALGLTIGLLLGLPAAAQEPAGEDPALASEPGKLITPNDAQNSMCLLLESAARTNGLPLEFFARVIWQESRFRADVVGPLTRSGKRAQGIAQFMPGTAAERNLLNPFDPIQALPKSAEFLGLLRRHTMPGPDASANGGRALAQCLPKRAPMCWRSPVPQSSTG